MLKRHQVLIICIFIGATMLSCNLLQGNSVTEATKISSTFIAGQTQNASAVQVEPQTTLPAEPLEQSYPQFYPGIYPVDKCMTRNVPAGVATSFPFEWKECVVAVEVQDDGSMKVIFEWEVTRTGPGSMPEGQCFTKGSDYQNPNMYMMDDLGNHYANTEVGMDIGICLLMGDMESNSTTDYFLFPPAQPGAKFLIFHDDDQGMQTDPFSITWVR